LSTRVVGTLPPITEAYCLMCRPKMPLPNWAVETSSEKDLFTSPMSFTSQTIWRRYCVLSRASRLPTSTPSCKESYSWPIGTNVRQFCYELGFSPLRVFSSHLRRCAPQARSRHSLNWTLNIERCAYLRPGRTTKPWHCDIIPTQIN